MKTYKIDTTQYTEEQINLLASHYGYKVDNNQQDIMDFIEIEFKKYADLWFAEPLISQSLKTIEVQKQLQVEGIKQLIAQSTVVEDSE